MIKCLTWTASEQSSAIAMPRSRMVGIRHWRPGGDVEERIDAVKQLHFDLIRRAVHHVQRDAADRSIDPPPVTLSTGLVGRRVEDSSGSYGHLRNLPPV